MKHRSPTAEKRCFGFWPAAASLAVAPDQEKSIIAYRAALLFGEAFGQDGIIGRDILGERFITHSHQVIYADAKEFGQPYLGLIAGVAFVFFVGRYGVVRDLQHISQLGLGKARCLAKQVQAASYHSHPLPS